MQNFSSMSVSAGSLIDKASILLQDTSNERYLREELLGWLNDAQRQVAQLKPTSTAVSVPVALVQGTKQMIPADGWQIMDVVRNLGMDGLTPGRSVRVVSRKLLDSQDPNWHNATPSGTVQNYVFNMQDGGNVFYVYPPSNGQNCVEVIYSRLPTDVVAETDTITVHPVYQVALVDYIVFRAASKDAEHTPMQDFAKLYLASFHASIQTLADGENLNNPNIAMSNPMPPQRGTT